MSLVERLETALKSSLIMSNYSLRIQTAYRLSRLPGRLAHETARGDVLNLA